MQYQFRKDLHFSPEEIRHCAAKELLLEAALAWPPQAEESSAAELLLCVPEQAAALGAVRILIYLCGEYEVDKLKSLLEVCQGASLKVQIHLSSKTHLCRECAEYFYSQKLPVTLAHAPEKTLEDLQTLFSAGYEAARDLITVSFTPQGDNTEQICEAASRYMEEKLHVCLDCLTEAGKIVPENQIPGVEKLEKLEKIFPHGRTFCLKHLYSCFIASDAKVYPCAGMGFPLGDLREKSLAQILQEGKYPELIRKHTLRIKAPCHDCTEILHCCGGCRVRAYQMTGDYLAADPLCRKNRDKLDQIHALPVAAEGMLPHGGPMALIERMIFLSEITSVHEAVIRDNNPFLDPEGILERSALPEYAAQACAVRDSVEKGGHPSTGLLSEVHHTRFYNTVLKAGDRLRITVQTEFHMDEWYGILFHIEKADGENVAEGALKLCIYDEIPAPY